ncbi:TetR/AcrR family transcriptional regulator [Lacisediminihabitans profunda]|uniref:TetR/AcrR family transcriptional regulator n=2 Tax=Lacisediminihabitans profunda TaxID=2594790 RepID=A0A5C8UJX4_9MICO|nr:TetR/AcrR family transcriptional regulator [Lacisediminihabitans profunda]
MIVDAVIPLLLEHGRDITTRQIADEAGIAEGTIFRAFGDKESIIQAAVDKFLDPLPLRTALRSIDPDLPLEQKVHDILFHLRARFAGIIGIMSAIGMTGRPPGHGGRNEFAEIVAEVLEPEAARLRLDPTKVAYLVRIIAFASSIGPFNDAHPLSTDELADIILHGIVTRPDNDNEE